ncbi:hypothetical protein K523DRAFT_54031 [Schizophyllum commune Tattone D]|nr:hypothetical protein K523DRAFT_54031 [Schizophyllum commune Tattone D]
MGPFRSLLSLASVAYGEGYMGRESPSCTKRRGAMACMPVRSCTVTPLGHKCVVMTPKIRSPSLLGKRCNALTRLLSRLRCTSK